MRRFADTLPTLRGGDTVRHDHREEAAILGPILGKLPPVRRESALERSRAAQAEILERTAARFDWPAAPVPEPRRAIIPALGEDRAEIPTVQVAEAVAAARASAEREREQAVAAARADAERAAANALAEARARWTEEEAGSLAADLASRLDELEANLAASLSRAVGPLLETAVHERTLARFRDILADILSGPRRAAIVVKGPDDLLDAFRVVWGDRGGVRLEVADRAELVADVGPSRLETSLVPFKTALAEALAAPAPSLTPKDRQNG